MTYERLFELIKSNHFEDVIEDILYSVAIAYKDNRLPELKDIRNALVTLSGKLTQIETDFSILKDDDRYIEYNKIRTGLLNIVDKYFQLKERFEF